MAASTASALVLATSPPPALADCREVATARADPSAYVRHLSPECTQSEREHRAISAEELMRVLVQGRGIDLSNVVIAGDLMLDRLPVVPIERIAGMTEGIRRVLADLSMNEARVLGGRISIQNSVVRGAIATRITQGAILVQGPHTMRGTVFEAPQDWSRTVFAGPLDWTQAKLQREGFFLQARFMSDVRFQGVQFGPHTRFHRAGFHAPAWFEEASFHGLAEFLEVSFRGDASFARVRFEQGTGFSGSRFERTANFSGALFSREGYFLFTRFDQAALFEGVRFQGSAEFAEAQFHGRADFAGVEFQQSPQWDRVTFGGERILPSAASHDWLNIGIIVGAGLAALTLFWVILRS